MNDETNDKPTSDVSAGDQSEDSKPYSIESVPAKRAKPALLDDSQATPDAPESAVLPKPVSNGGSNAAFAKGYDRGLAHRGRALVFALGGIIVLALGFGGGWLGAAAHHDNGTANVTEQKVVLKGEAAVISDIAKNVGQSVVSVDVTSQSSASPYASIFGFGGGSGQQEDAGTGIILTSDGLIMTNRHVVPSGATNVSITLSDGTVYDNVKVVGRTNDGDSLDVAFLQIQDTKGKTLVPAKIGDSSGVKVGDPVVAIGNALGQFQNTVTSGIISGYGRTLQAQASDGSSSESLDNLFQTDAAINEGNSGGPLVNLDGQVIGMNTAMASDSQSIGFAIPINDLSGLIDSVKATGTLQRPYMGVVYVPITSDVKQQYGLSVSNGAYIPTSAQAGQTTVISGGPADKAGVQPGDIITQVDGSDVNQTTSLASLLNKHKVGDKVSLTIVRGGKTITKAVTLDTAPSQ